MKQLFSHLQSSLANWQSQAHQPASQLFLYSDGFKLTAAVISKQDEQLTILATAQSSEAPGSALQEVLSSLSGKLDNLPSHAIMLHSRIALGLLNLPVAENTQLDDKKIANIVRWEMETLYNEQAPQWQIGSLLVQLGIISEQERDDIVQQQQQNRHRAASFGGKLQRFGEVIIEMGKLTENELEHYLNLQNELQDTDSHYNCGWHAPQQAEELFCAAMNNQEMLRWVNAFADNNLRIDRFYPVAGTLAALLEEETRVCLLELHPTQLVCSLLHEGQFQQMEIINCVDHSLTVEDVVGLLEKYNDQHKVLFYGNHPRSDSLYQQLQDVISTPIHSFNFPESLLVSQSAEEDLTLVMPLLGVAKDYFFQTLQYGRVPYVQGMEPPLPFYRQSRWQITMAATVLILLCLAYDLFLQNQLTSSQEKITQLSEDYTKQKKSNKQLKRNNRRYLKLDKELQKLEVSYEKLQHRKKYIEDNLIERQRFMQELLSILVNSVDGDVVLDGLHEESWYYFRLSGWAFNQDAVDRFKLKLTRQLNNFNMLVSRSPSQLIQNGDLAGAYQFTFDLTRKPVEIKDKKT